METPAPPPGPDRFDRQRRFAPLGAEGQARLQSARVLLAGCGALGGVLAQTLTRCGVGALVLVDRDVVDLTNLPRQVLFEDGDLGRPKAEAAAAALARIGGPTRVEAHAEHLDAENLEELAAGCDLVLDGTDNLATRYLLNDYAVETGTPWVYGGVVGSGGLVLPVVPGRGACLRCVFPDPPPPGALPTCDSAGVILPAVSAVASLQAGAALFWLGASEGAREAFVPYLTEVDVWFGDVRRVEAGRDPACPCCGERDFPFLRAPAQRSAWSLCGRNTVQVRPPVPTGVGGRKRADLTRIAASVRGAASDVRELGTILRFEVEGLCVTVFADGRALLEGTDDVDRARAVYDRYVGS
jgi:adenylyltransferase/sulfurtransferase